MAAAPRRFRYVINDSFRRYNRCRPTCTLLDAPLTSPRWSADRKEFRDYGNDDAHGRSQVRARNSKLCSNMENAIANWAIVYQGKCQNNYYSACT